MIEKLIAACARHPLVVVLLVGTAVIAGLLAISHTPLDAIPDLSDTQVVITTEWMGRSPDLVEAQVTYPLVSALRSAPGVRYVRGLSMTGDSFVYVVFEDNVDLYWARSRVLEQLAALKSRMPAGVSPQLGPDATGVGWVFEYALVDTTGTHDLAELRRFQDWTMRYWLQGVPGVAEVAPVGGFVREYQVDVDPVRLEGAHVTFAEVADAVAQAYRETGGGVVDIAGHEQAIRGRAAVTSDADIAATPIRAGAGGVPVRVGDVADVHLGPAARRGIAELDGRGEVVGGIVIMRQHENALRVIDGVKKRLDDVRKSLPPGVQLVVTYDRSELIKSAVGTLRRSLVEEMLIVSLVIVLFLFHLRSALIPVITLPVAVLLAFLPMAGQHITANIMSLGGIAVAIGAMVDASIIMVENVHKALEAWELGDRREPRREVMIRALQEVGRPLFFALLVITLSFIPIFTLTGTEGRLFRPLALTKTYSMAFAALLAVTLTPALAMWLIRGRIRGEHDHPISRPLVRAYAPVVRWVARHPKRVVFAAALLVISTIPVASHLGSEFMPPLNEGTLLAMPTAPPGMSDSEARDVLQRLDGILKQVPEVDRVFGKNGRALTATDPAPLGMIETVVTFKPHDQWRPSMTWDGLIADLDKRVRIPGMPNIWWMPIQTRNEMLATGVRSAVGVRVFGSDLATVEQTALAVEDAIRGVKGARSVYTERATGGLYLDVDVDRGAAARYGVTPAQVATFVESAIGGMPAGDVVDGRARTQIVVRAARDWRGDADALSRLLIPAGGASGAMAATGDASMGGAAPASATPATVQVPLGAVAHIAPHTGPPMIQEEDGELFTTVSVDVADRALADFVHDAQSAVAAQVTLPAGTRLDWAGQFRAYESARRRLQLVVPLTLLLVAGLLLWNLRSIGETLIVLLAVPFSLVGAIWLVWLLGYNMSVAVWVGVIALAGLDAETGSIMLLYLTLALRDRTARGALHTREDLHEAIVEGAAHRIRPKLMTVAAILLGLLPILWSHGTGSDVMKRIAAPMVGGVLTSFVLELLVYPAVFAWWKGRALVRSGFIAK